jgi:beta-galactosidase
VGTVQPNLGLDRLFGVRESYVEFTPDLLGDLRLEVNGKPVWGGLFLQAYEPVTAQAAGFYEDPQLGNHGPAACDHQFGEGRVRLVGSMCGYGYAAHPGDRSPAFFQDLLAFAGKTPHVRSSDPLVKARLHDGPGGTYLWVANPARQPVPVWLELSQAWGPYKGGSLLWGEGVGDLVIVERTVALTVPARDGVVIRLEG